MQTTSTAYSFLLAWICEKVEDRASKNISYCSSFHFKLECGGDTSANKKEGEKKFTFRRRAVTGLVMTADVNVTWLYA